MAQFVVRNLEDDVMARLKRRAARHGRGVEEEVRHILRNAVREPEQEARPLGTRIASRFAKIGFERNLSELSKQPARPAFPGQDAPVVDLLGDTGC